MCIRDRRLAEQTEVLDKANDVIVVRDIAGRVLYWNQTASRLLGVSAADAVGRSIHDVLGVEAERIEESTDKVLADGESVSYTHLYMASSAILTRASGSAPQSGYLTMPMLALTFTKEAPTAIGSSIA